MMELLDTYNAAHERLRTGVPRSNSPDLAEGEHFLICHVCIFSPSGRMLVQKRSASKEIAPGCFDVSAGGFVQSGETVQEAVIREAAEEIGFSVSPDELEFTKCFPIYWALDDFFLARAKDEQLPTSLQKEEVDEVCWMGQDEILERIADETFVNYAPELINYMFSCFKEERG